MSDRDTAHIHIHGMRRGLRSTSSLGTPSINLGLQGPPFSLKILHMIQVENKQVENKVQVTGKISGRSKLGRFQAEVRLSLCDHGIA